MEDVSLLSDSSGMKDKFNCVEHMITTSIVEFMQVFDVFESIFISYFKIKKIQAKCMSGRHANKIIG
jgi:hypothetical protein